MNSANIFPILQFDPDPHAILEPHPAVLEGPAPERAVLCFFQEVLTQLAREGYLVKIGNLLSELGENPVYRLEHHGQSLLVTHPGVGAPLAAGFLDELIASGVHKVIACGGCGVLGEHIDAGHPIILTSAVRDEGTSYHYLPPGREVAAHPKAVEALRVAFEQANEPYRLAKTWTTDGLYRETAGRRLSRLADGCEVVEMEAAAFFAVAEFRKIELGQVVYGGDLVVPEGWDARGWNQREASRRFLFWTAVEACVKL
jgi:uridine phosphorylase